MSWDVFAQDYPPVSSIDQVPDDFEPASLGPRDAIIRKITAAFPSADFTEPDWGVLEGEDWSIEISLGEEEECEGLALHVRGRGEEAIDAVARILEVTGLRALDAQTGEFFEVEAARQSFAQWVAYCDKIELKQASRALPLQAEEAPRGGFLSRLFSRARR